MDDVINLGGIEIVANDNGSEGDGDPIRFEIQAWVDGKWVLLASEDQYLFDATRAANYTFDAVRTAKVRILIHSYYDREARLKEITLFEETTGNLTKTLNLNGKIGESDAENSYVANYLIDGNKASGVEFTDTLIDVDTTGKGVVVDGFVLYPHRADREFPTEVTISFLTVGGSWFEEIGTYKTNWRRNSVLEPLVITFDQPYIITAAIVNISTGSLNEFELFQFQRTQPVVMPTVPTEPTEAPTRPTTAPTEPTEAPTEPEATEPEATEPEATEPEATQPEVTEPEATEPEATQPAATEPEVTEPEVTEPEATEPEATEPEATEPEATEPEETQPEATQPEATQPAGEKSDTAEEPKSNTGLIISIVAAIVVVAAVVVVVLKKKS